MIRKKNFVKLLVLVPLVWLAAVVFINPSLENKTEDKLRAEKEHLQALLRKNHEQMHEMMKRNDEEKKAIVEKANENIGEVEVEKAQLNEELKNKEQELKDKIIERKDNDHDHPEEEKNQAVKQVQEKAILVQVKAPAEKHTNNSAPGQFSLLVYDFFFNF
jgi:predicted nuclease with TOPRIM domain